jgi:crossover junction endodeoxyribonuclease RusA
MIELPWPPKELTPNFKRRKHWTVYRPKTVQYRADCALVARGWFNANGQPKGLRIVSVTFYPPDHRKRDDDGMIGAFKAGRDGIADAIGTDDHKFRPAYHFAEPVKHGKIVVRIEP